MLELGLRTTAILAAAWLIVRMMPNATAATRHLVWHATFVAVLAAPALAPIAPSWSLPVFTFTVSRPSSEEQGIERQAQTLQQTVLDILPLPLPQGSNTTRVDGAATPFRLVWLAGAMIAFAWFTCGWMAAAVAVRRGRRVPGSWQLELNALCERLGIHREVGLRIRTDSTVPVVVGLFRSIVLLPKTALGWDADRRRTVLLHELAHVRRGDCRVQAIAQAACVLYWFNPLVWIGVAHLRAERERACDDEVLRCGTLASAYARHLLAIARGLRPALGPSAALAMARPSDLEVRLLAVLAQRRRRVPARASRWAVAAALALVSAAALGATPSTSIEKGTVPSVDAVEAKTTVPLFYAQAPSIAPTEVARFDEKATVRPLETALNDSSQDVREKAALGLAFMSGPDVIPALLKALKDSDAQVREKAAIGLALRRDPRVADALIHAINDPDPQVREKVAIALGTSADPRASAALERALNDSDAQVREKAVTGLLLIRLTGGSGPAVR